MFSAWDPSTPTLGAPGGERAELGPSGFVRSPFSRLQERSGGGGSFAPCAPTTSGSFPGVAPGQLGDPSPSPRSGPECVCRVIRKPCWGEGRMAPGAGRQWAADGTARQRFLKETALSL